VKLDFQFGPETPRACSNVNSLPGALFRFLRAEVLKKASGTVFELRIDGICLVDCLTAFFNASENLQTGKCGIKCRVEEKFGVRSSTWKRFDCQE